MVLIALSVPLAACGSSGSSSSAGGGSTVADPSSEAANHAKALQFASCMRTHGVPNFPDPKSNGGGGLLVQASPNGTIVNGVKVNGPAFQGAMQSCKSDLPNGGNPRPLSEAQRNRMLAFSQCMRAHGITNFPDPTFHGARVGVQLKGSGLNPSSPAFQSAQKACGQPFGKVSAVP